MKKIILIVLALAFSLSLIAQEFSNYTVKHLETVNFEKSDFGVSYYGEGKVIFASSREGKKTRSKKWDGNQQAFLQLFTGNIDADGEIVDIEYFSDVINTKYHESNAVFTADLSTVYFSRNNYYKHKLRKTKNNWSLVQLYKAEVDKNGKWHTITPMPFNNINYQTGHPSLNAEETKLYFTSDMQGSLGLTDIWVVDIHKDGTYGDPVNLGPTVNTASKEMFPYITESNRLFFSSEQGGGNGGLDVYVSALKEGDLFEKSTNLGAPLNSVSDDFSFIVDENTHTGYFSSNRADGKGDDDIYYFTEEVKEEIEEEVKEEIIPCFQIADGTVRDKKTNALLPGALVVLYDMTDPLNKKKIESIIVGDDASFSFKVACDTSYLVIGSKRNFSEDSKRFTSTNKTALNLDLDLGITLEEVFEERGGNIFIKINPIYFDLDKSYIRADAALELDQVVRVMRKYPNMIVQGGSHTDARGSSKYNRNLSSRRATSTVAYITSQGISSSRISAQGYGETRLVNNCTDNDKHTNRVRCTDSEHQMNRRTEFQVLQVE